MAPYEGVEEVGDDFGGDAEEGMLGAVHEDLIKGRIG